MSAHSREQLLQMLIDGGVFEQGTFVLAHDARSVRLKCNISNLEKRPDILEVLGMALASRIEQPASIHAVTGVATGALILVDPVIRALNKRREGLPPLERIDSRKTEAGGFEIEPKDWARIKGKHVLVIEDVITTGESSRKVIDAVHSAGGNAYALAAVLQRNERSLHRLGGVSEFVVLIELNFTMTLVEHLMHIDSF